MKNLEQQNKNNEFKLKPLAAEVFAHMAVFGGSGKGKTESVGGPYLHMTLASETENGEEASVLVIDAKNEYEQIVTDILGDSDRLLVLDGKHQRFNPFEIDAAKSLEEKLMPLYMMTEGTDPKQNGQNSSFAVKAKSLMTEFLRIDQAYFDKTGRSILADANKLVEFCDKNYEDIRVKNILEELKESHYRVNGGQIDLLDKRQFSCFIGKAESFWKANNWGSSKGYFEEFSDFIRRTHIASDSLSGHNLAMGTLVLLADIYSLGDQLSLIRTMQDMRKPRDEQWFYYTSYFEPFFTLMLGKRIKSYCELEPLSNSKSVSLVEHFDRGGVVLLKLNPADNDDLILNYVGRFLKRVLFKYTFIRKNINRPVAYFADEAHRFITADRETGEHNFMDRCRAFNAMVFLSTQSIQSIKQAIKEQTGTVQNEVVDIILNNTGTKYFFGTSDPVTQDYVAKITAKSPIRGMPNVTDVRPLASLDVGSCYHYNHNGSWGIKKHNLGDIKRQNQLYRDEIKAKLDAQSVSSPSVAV